MTIKIHVDKLSAHPKNPRIEPRQEVVDQIAAQIAAKGGFDESHALIVRAVNGSQYQIISGHHRWLAAQQAGVVEVPCWVREMTDEQAYMELVLCNTQSELHPLEEGLHALESGMSQREYAEWIKKSAGDIQKKQQAAKVMRFCIHVDANKVMGFWRNLAEIHAAEQWLWSALVEQMVADNWTVAATRDKVAVFKDVPKELPNWVNLDKVAESLVTGQMTKAEAGKLATLVENAKVDGEFRSGMLTELESEMPSLLSEVQAIVAKWEKEQADAVAAEKQAEIERQKSSEAARKQLAKRWVNISLDEWKTLSEAEQQAILIPRLGEGGKFNQQESADIEWAQWSWNPVTGCKHDCSYCYARDIANSKKMEKSYPNGFAPSFRSNALNAPQNTRVPDIAKTDARFKNVFTCSMADLFGRWVPIEWIDAVMNSVRDNQQWNFLFLTKFPQRLSEIEIPENAWMGTTVDLQARVANAEKAFEKIKCGIKWLSIEPMIEPIRFNKIELFDWVVIGGASSSERTPAWRPPYRWIESLVKQCDEASIPVYFKSNLGIANRILELPFAAPVTQDQQRADDSFYYLNSAKN